MGCAANYQFVIIWRTVAVRHTSASAKETKKRRFSARDRRKTAHKMYLERVFQWVLNEAGTAGALSPAAVFIDGTHIKASANLNKKIKQEVPAAAKRYRDELLAEINADREAHGKKPFDDDDDPPRPTKKKRDNTSKKKLARRKKAGFKTVTKSTTDPDCGMFVKGKHERQFAYEAHTACEKNGYVLETVVTPGNVHDSVAFDDVYDKVTESFPQIETIVADSAYKTPHICKKVFNDGRVLSTAYKRPMTLKGGHQWWKYVYDEYYDCVICPEYQPLAYRTTNRDGYREYGSDPKICAQCPTRQLCTHSKNCVKTVLRHVWKDYEDLADDARYTPEYKDLYAKRKETIERVFADAKEKHGMRYTLYRGLAQVSNWVRLKFAAMNLKKLARWKAKRLSTLSFLLFSALMYLLCFAACQDFFLAGRFSTSCLRFAQYVMPQSYQNMEGKTINWLHRVSGFSVSGQARIRCAQDRVFSFSANRASLISLSV